MLKKKEKDLILSVIDLAHVWPTQPWQKCHFRGYYSGKEYKERDDFTSAIYLVSEYANARIFDFTVNPLLEAKPDSMILTLTAFQPIEVDW
ncbi:Protein CBG05024 [Caenorhabditis briggsae]|uniref:Protein CBG05024 n=1 Tax=Caenorhabditis briggsae TaxID=6238 RepID=A8WZ01_CAEBR|nr:Protein CBG05024 [Caenorhabditis briggsae]CAP25610.1 Protein CBG05024 [Caenorhabditis briggsae]